jgi:hypothetical protein
MFKSIFCKIHFIYNIYKWATHPLNRIRTHTSMAKSLVRENTAVAPQNLNGVRLRTREPVAINIAAAVSVIRGVCLKYHQHYRVYEKVFEFYI